MYICMQNQLKVCNPTEVEKYIITKCIYFSLLPYGGVAYLVPIAPAYRTEDAGFESRQGVRFLGLYTLQCCCRNLVCIVIVFT
jgi:hypothetical protein